MVTCPKCGRQVRPQPLCLYCGAKLQTTPVAILGMNAQQWLAEGTRVLGLAQRERAEKAFRSALQIDPTLDQAWLLLTGTLAELGRHGEARTTLDEGLRANPGSALLREALKVADTVKGAGDPIIAARRLAEAGNHAAAVSTLDQVLRNPAFRAVPESAVVLVMRGCSKQALGRLDDALADFTAATRANPAYALAHYDRADVLDDLGRHGEALHAIDDALRVDPAYANAWSNRGYLLRKLGRDDEALAAYDRALALDAANPNTWLNKGNLLAHRGQAAAARSCFERVLALQPDHPQARGALEALVPDRRPAAPSVLSQVAAGDAGAVFALHATRKLLERWVIPGAEAILAVHARLELPPVSASLWGAQDLVSTGVGFECLLKDGRALAIRSAGGRAALDAKAVSPQEMRAWGALVQSGGVRRVLLVTDAPVGEALARELASVNARLRLPTGEPAIEVVQV